MFAIKVAYIGYLVIDIPSVNCLIASKITNGIKENATKFKYGIANTTTSSGCCIKYISGFEKKTNKKSRMPKVVHKNSPCL